MTVNRWVAAAAPFTVLFTLISCSSAPAPPRVGTPAFYWQGAREAYAAGDSIKTMENLDNLLTTDNEYLDRALPWALVLKSGLAEGYEDLAGNYSVGARLNRSDPSTFRRVVTESRDRAGRLSLQFAEAFAKFDEIKGANIQLDFGFPRGSAAPVAEFTKVASGVPFTAADAEKVQAKALEHGVVLAACKAVGAPGDSAKAEELYKGAAVLVPRPTFLLAMADTLYNQSLLFTPDKLDQPEKLRIFCERAQAALAAVPESKESKDLSKQIEAALKSKKKT